MFVFRIFTNTKAKIYLNRLKYFVIHKEIAIIAKILFYYRTQRVMLKTKLNQLKTKKLDIR